MRIRRKVSFFVNLPALGIAKADLDPMVTLEGVLRLEHGKPIEDRAVACGHPRRLALAHWGTSSFFFEHRCELAHQRFQPRILPLQARVAVGLPMDFEGTNALPKN